MVKFSWFSYSRDLLDAFICLNLTDPNCVVGVLSHPQKLSCFLLIPQIVEIPKGCHKKSGICFTIKAIVYVYIFKRHQKLLIWLFWDTQYMIVCSMHDGSENDTNSVLRCYIATYNEHTQIFSLNRVIHNYHHHHQDSHHHHNRLILL